MIRQGLTLRNALMGLTGNTVWNGGTLAFRTLAPPATVGGAEVGTLLVSITLPADPFTDPVAGVITKQGVWSAVAAATGVAGHFRFFDSLGNILLDGTLGEVGSGADMEIENTSINSGQTVTIGAGTVTMPESC
jgi:hypothetical protein